MSAGFILKLGSDVGDFKPHNVMYGDKKGDSRESIDTPPVDGAYPTAEDEEPDADQVASALAANGGRGGGAFEEEAAGGASPTKKDTVRCAQYEPPRPAAQRPGRGPTQPRFAPAAAPRALRAPWTEVAPGAGLLRATKGRDKSQTQLRWVSQARPQGTHYVPDNNWPAAGVEAGGLFRRRGPRRGPGGRGAHPGGPQNRRRRISRWLDPLGFASRVLLRGPN